MHSNPRSRLSIDSRSATKPFESIVNKDAILDLSDSEHPEEPEWPAADFIVGNPPFLGSSLYRDRGINDDDVAAMTRLYRLPGKSDLCCYWFEKARRQLLIAPNARV